MTVAASRKGNVSRQEWRRRTLETFGQNQQLAMYCGQLETCMKAILGISVKALDGMFLVWTPGQAKSRTALKQIAEVAAPFAADLPLEVLNKLIPPDVRKVIQPYLNPKLINKPKGGQDAGNSQEAGGEVQGG